MALRSRLVLAVTSAAALALVTACGDDPTGAPADTWQDVHLPDLGSAGLWSVAARGSRVVAVGVAGSATVHEAVGVETTGGNWERLTFPTWPIDVLYAGVAIDASGSAVFVGARAAEQPVVLDERAGWQAATLPVVGLLNAVAAGQSSTWIAVGTASGGLAAISTSPGAWLPDHAGFTTLQEKGLVDVSHAGGQFVACGWDDATVGPVLRLHDGTGWKELAGPGAITLPEIREEYRAVLLEANGALWLGGTTVDTSQFSPIPRARLARRPASGDWVEIVLPDPEIAQSVNDVLRAADGSLYLACGETTARVLRYDGTTWLDEGPGGPGRFLSLAEDGAGRIYAAGMQWATISDPRPLLRVRHP